MLRTSLAFVFALGLVSCSGDDDAEDMDAGTGGYDAGRGDAAMADGLSCEDCTLEAVMPTPGVDCGIQGPGGRDSEVASCVEANLASATPFHAVQALQGTDSQIALGWALDESGALERYHFDSSICGGSGCEVEGCGPRVSVVLCEEPSFVPDEDAGVDGGDELIACGDAQAKPDACGP